MPHSKTFAPKRPIEAVNSRAQDTLTTGKTTSIVRTVGDRETLVRSILSVNVIPLSTNDVDINNTFEYLLNVRPAAAVVVSPSTADALAQVKSKNEILRDRGTVMQNITTNVGTQFDRTYDIKGMRKLNVGDLVTFDTICSEASNAKITWSLTQFFKQ